MNTLVDIQGLARMFTRFLRDPPHGARRPGPESQPEKEAGEDDDQSCTGQFQGGRAEEGKSWDHAPVPDVSVELVALASLRTKPIRKAIAAAILARC